MSNEQDRRTFLKTTAVLAGSGLAPAVFARSRSETNRLGNEDTLRIALVGCGGRGTGAAAQALATDGAVELVAMADAFRDRLDRSHSILSERAGDRVQVPEENKYVGFDAYRQAIDSGADVVVLATPPGFRPQHFEYAVARGKHVFMEKPVAVDAPGIRRVLAAGKRAEEKNLKVGVGLQRHHQQAYRATLDRIHDGAIGKPVLLRVYWNSAGVWVRPREAEMTEMEYQMRNWYYFNWLCGDHIVEQHIHNLDVGNWVMDSYPVTAQGQGGRQWRTGKEYGEIYDHHFVEYTYGDGTKMLSQCRHMKNCWDQVSEHLHGSDGVADLSAARIEPSWGSAWHYDGEEADPYQVEHDDLFAAIRQDRPYNEVENGALSTMTAILGRMATYSGKVVTWEEALASDLSLAPDRYDFEAPPPVLPDDEGRYRVAIPGETVVL